MTSSHPLRAIVPPVKITTDPLPEHLASWWVTADDAEFRRKLEERAKYPWGKYGQMATGFEKPSE